VPIALVPETTVETAASRDALPAEIPYDDAAFTTGRAALLGAALASGSPDLFAEALDDRLHEPYRTREAPLLTEVRERLPRGALGATLSGSGPTVVVWARDDDAAACADELTRTYPSLRVLTLAVSAKGAHES
jgi:homoserine kinase